MTSNVRKDSARVLAVFFLLGSLFQQPAEGATFISGELPDVVTLGNSPYIALTTLTLTGHSCLVEAGVEINFTANTGIQIKTSGVPTALTIAGTSSAPVLMRGWNGGQWYGIFKQNSTPPDFAFVADWLNLEGATIGIQLQVFGAGPVTIEMRDCSLTGVGQGSGVQFEEYFPEISANISLERVSIAGFINNFVLHVDDPASLVDCVATGANDRGYWLIGAVQGVNLSASNNEIGFGIDPVPLTSLTSSSATDNQVTGIYVAAEAVGEPFEITDTVITGNGTYGVTYSSPLIVSGCTIFDNGQWDVHTQTPVIPYTTINMHNNDWGPTTTAEMQAEGTFSNIEKIYDWWDNSQMSLVDFEGFIVPTSAPDPGVKPASWAEIKSRYR